MPTAAGSHTGTRAGLALTSKPTTRHGEPAGHNVLTHCRPAPHTAPSAKGQGRWRTTDLSRAKTLGHRPGDLGPSSSGNRGRQPTDLSIAAM
jgi:hypothetical protein